MIKSSSNKVCVSSCPKIPKSWFDFFGVQSESIVGYLHCKGLSDMRCS